MGLDHLVGGCGAAEGVPVAEGGQDQRQGEAAG